jgi:hypothetical protein
MASQINTFDSLEVWRQKINPYLQMTSNVTKDSIIFQNQTTGSTSTDGFLIGLGGSDGRLWNYENAGVVFGTSAVERMRITGTGNVAKAAIDYVERSVKASGGEDVKEEKKEEGKK